jgi:DNA-binding transcriptional regulator YiaG
MDFMKRTSTLVTYARLPSAIACVISMESGRMMTEAVHHEVEKVECPSCDGTGEVSVNRVKALRITLGLSPRSLASALGVSVRTIHHWEAGDNEPHAIFVRKMEEMVSVKEADEGAK